MYVKRLTNNPEVEVKMEDLENRLKQAELDLGTAPELSSKSRLALASFVSAVNGLVAEIRDMKSHAISREDEDS